jgi:hypothetical protein
MKYISLGLLMLLLVACGCNAHRETAAFYDAKTGPVAEMVEDDDKHLVVSGKPEFVVTCESDHCLDKAGRVYSQKEMADMCTFRNSLGMATNADTDVCKIWAQNNVPADHPGKPFNENVTRAARRGGYTHRNEGPGSYRNYDRNYGRGW